MSGIGSALARVRDKHRKGLFGLWAWERLTSALARLGLRLHLSVIYREGTRPDDPPDLLLTDCSIGFSTPDDIAEIAAVEAYPISVDEMRERFERGAECYLLRHRGKIVAFTWCEAGGAPRPRLGLKFGPEDVYLFDAHTAPSFRGLNLLPFLRYHLYRDLHHRGYRNLLSSTVCFNRPAHRFKQKLGALPEKMTLYLSLFSRLERVFVVWRFRSGHSGQHVAKQPVE
jgi:hypothetical protein